MVQHTAFCASLRDMNAIDAASSKMPATPMLAPPKGRRVTMLAVAPVPMSATKNTEPHEAHPMPSSPMRVPIMPALVARTRAIRALA